MQQTRARRSVLVQLSPIVIPGRASTAKQSRTLSAAAVWMTSLRSHDDVEAAFGKRGEVRARVTHLTSRLSHRA